MVHPKGAVSSLQYLFHATSARSSWRVGNAAVRLSYSIPNQPALHATGGQFVNL